MAAALGLGWLRRVRWQGRRKAWRERRPVAVIWAAQDVIPEGALASKRPERALGSKRPEGALAGRRGAGAGGGPVRRAGEMAAGLGAVVGAREAGPSAPGLGGQVRDAQITVADVMPRGTGRPDARQEAAGHAAVASLARSGSRGLRAAQAEAGPLIGRLARGRPGRASPVTGRRRGRAAGRPMAGRRDPGVVGTGTWPETIAGRRAGGHRRAGDSVTGT